MRVTEKMKKLLSILLCLCMLVQNCPVVAFAAGEDNLCEHHPEHTAECHYAEAVAGVECAHECSECANSESTAVCTCGTDDPDMHATFCDVYTAPEDPQCYCVEKCGVETQNFWCDVCGFDYTQCGGTDRSAGYGTGWEIEETTLIVTGHLTALPEGVEYSEIEVHEGGNLDLGTTEVTCDVYVGYGGAISSGTFRKSVHNAATISGGTFYNDVVNDGTISGGTFIGHVSNYGTITDVTFWYATVSNSEYATISNAKFESNAKLAEGSIPPQSVIHSVNGKDVALTYNADLPAALGEAAAWYQGDTQVTGGSVPLNYTNYVGEYKISTAAATNGTVSVPATAKFGQTVTVTATASEGYALDTVTVKHGEAEITVTDNAFTMPAGAVTISATFKACTHETYEKGVCTLCGVECTLDYDEDGFCENGCFEPAEEAEGVYQIGNAGNLFWFAQMINDGTEGPVNAVLTDDIDLEDREWTPIGTNGNSYSGLFNGSDYIVSGLSVSTNADSEQMGLFGAIKGAGIRNLTVSGSASSDTGVKFAGMLVAEMQDSILYNCYASGKVSSANEISPDSAVGGLVGCAKHSVIINCGSSAAVDSTTGDVGGLVGYMTAGYDNPLCLLNSYCTGTVSGENAGLVGYLADDAVNNYYSGGVLFGDVRNSIMVNNATQTFTPLIEKNYYIPGDTGAIGGATEGLDTTGYAEAYSSAADLMNKLNGNLEQVEEIITGHRGYLQDSDWAELVELLDGASVTVSHWRLVNGAVVHCSGSGTLSLWVPNAEGTAHVATWSCCGGSVTEDHTGGTATCKEQAVCENCGAGYGEALGHSYNAEGTCTNDGCDAQLMVYVGGVALKFGEYLASGADSVSAAAPASGGYAYFSNGVLTLQDYEYTGEGYEGGAIYSENALTVELAGESTLTTDSMGIYTLGNITFQGSGTLNIDSYGDGVDVEGVFTMSGGTLTIEAGEDGIDCTDAINISGGTVTITAGESGLESDGDTTITGGNITIRSDMGCNGNMENPALLMENGGKLTLGSKMTITEPADGKVETVPNVADPSYTINTIVGANGEPATQVELVGHIHAWTYTADGDTITATCGNGAACPDPEQSITISAVGKTYDGNPVEAMLTGSIDGVADPEIIYSGNKNVGTHTASITIEGKTASVEFTIAECPHERFSEGVCTVCGIIGGYCGGEGDGTNLTWTLVDGKLTISGTGAMADNAFTDIPWSDKQNITKIVMNDGVTSIGNSAFRVCENLAEVSLPSSMITIGESAFAYCASLTEIQIPDGVETIGRSAFLSCESLAAATVPASVTTIGASAFGYTPAKITVDEQNINYASDEYGVLFTKDKGTLIFFPKRITDYAVPEGVTEISRDAFHGSNITNITLPDSLRTIGSSGFRYCENLKSITIPSGVTAIGENAFTLSNNLTDVYVSCSWEKNPLYTFDEDVTVNYADHIWDQGECDVCGEVCDHSGNTNEATNNSNGTHSFECSVCNTAVTEDHTGGTATCTEQAECQHCGAGYGDLDPDNHTYESNVCCGYCGDPDVNGGKDVMWTLTDGKLTIKGSGPMADYVGGTIKPWSDVRDGITSVAIGQGVTTIGYGAFEMFEALTAVELPEGMTTIGGFAFNFCKKLAEISIPSTVTVIDEYAFGYSALTAVEIPAGVTTIGEGAFINCGKLAEISIPNTVTAMGVQVFTGCEALTGITIPGSVKSIGALMFWDCTALETVTLDNGVETIGGSAFRGCTALKEITIPASVTSIGTNAFSGCDTLETANVSCGWAANPLYTFADTVTVNIDEHTYENGKCSVCGAYDLWVAGEQITESHLTVNGTTGTATYDPATDTLTLNGFDNGDKCYSFTSNEYPYYAAVFTMSDLNIVLVGENSLYVNIDSEGYKTAIQSSGGLTIGGEGSLAAGTENWCISAVNGITITGGTLDIYGTTVLDGSATITGGNVSLNTTDFVCYGTLTVNGGEVTLSAGSNYIEAFGCTMVIGDDMAAYDENGALIENPDFERLSYALIKEAHVHSWTYTAKGDTIIATCNAEGCPDPEQSITLQVPDSYTYSGEALYSASVMGSIDGVSYTVLYTGTKTNYSSANAPVNADTYTVTLTAGGKSVSGSFTINPKNIANCTAKLSESSFTYDGKAPALTVSVVDSGVGSTPLAKDTDYTVGTVQVNAGNHKLTVTGKGNYTGTVELDYSISPKEVSITGAEIQAVTYNPNGYTLTVTGVTFDGVVDGENLAYTAEAILGNTNAFGEQDATVTVTLNNSNYNLVTATYQTKVTINKAAVTVTAAPTPNTLTYTGEALYLISAGEANGGTMQYSTDNQTWSTTIPQGTDAGEYIVYYKVVGDANHSDTAVDSVEVTIAKAQAVITVDTTTITVTYGETVSLPTATTNFGTVVCDKTADDLVNAGTYTVTYTVAGTENFEGATKTLTVKVEQLAVAEPTVTGTYTYTGSELTAQLTGLESCMTIASGNKGTNAGNHEVQVTLDGNHKWAEGSDGKIPWSIDKAKAEISVNTDPITVTYGETVTLPTATTNFGDVVCSKKASDIVNAGTYTVTYTVAGTDNYTGDTKSITVIVNAKAITVTADALSKTYGDADPKLTYKVEGLVNGDELTGELKRVAGENVGSYTIEQNTLTAGDNYTITYTGANLTINAKAITEADVELNGSLTYTGKELTQPITVTEGITYTVIGDKATNVGTYVLTVQGTGNYTGEVKLSWSIKETAAVVGKTPTAKELTYIGAAQALVNAGTTADGKLVYSLSENGEFTDSIPTGQDAGEYTVWYYVQGDDNHSDSAKASVKVTIAKADPVIGTVGCDMALFDSTAASAVELTRTDMSVEGTLVLTDSELTAGEGTYNWKFTPKDTNNYNTITGTVVLNVTADVLEKIEASGTLEKDSYSYGDTFSIDGLTVTATYTTGATKDVTELVSFDNTLAVGQTSVKLTYQGKTCTVTGFTVAKKQLVIDRMAWDIPENAVYNGTEYTATLNGTLPTGVVVTLSGDKATNAGSYTAKAVFSLAEGYSADNYEIVNGGDLTADWTIAKKNIVGAQITLGTALTYNGKQQTQTVAKVEIDGLTVTYTVSGNTGTDAKGYTLTVTGNGNFEGTETKEWSIAKKNISGATITLGDSLTYNGDAQTQEVTEVKIGDLTVTYDVTANKQTNAGNYTLTVTGNGNFEGSATADWSIAKAKLTITANNNSITYGDVPAANGVTGTGFVSSESIEDLAGELTYSYNYEQFGNVGTYKITPSGVTSNNYEITFADGTLTVNAKAITVTADALSKTYGEADPALTYKVEGLVNGDELTGELKRVAGENVGDYAIEQNTLTAGNNYRLTYTGAKLTINAKAITEADVELNGSLTYNGKEQTQPITVTAGITYEVTGNKATNVGTYELTVQGTGNYTGSVTLDWTIAKAKLTITADSKVIYIGEKVPTLTYTASGLVGGDKLTKEPVLTTNADADQAGSYTITAANADAGDNYTITYVSGSLTIMDKETEVETKIEQTELTEVPEGLKDTQFDTVEEIKEELISKILATSTGYSAENMVHYDVALHFSLDGGDSWILATEENFPTEGITVILPYPEGTNARDYEFVVSHMFTVTSQRLGTVAGEVEMPKVEETANGIRVTLNGLSPVTVAARYHDHTGGTATCTEKAVCTICGNAYGEVDKTNHAGGTEVKDAKEATCGAEGYTGDTYCKGCNKVVEKGTTIKATGEHTYGDWKVVKEPTKTTKGEKQRTCSVCGHVDSKEIPVLSDTPATGDNSNIMLYSSMFTVSLAGLVVLLLAAKKRKQETA